MDLLHRKLGMGEAYDVAIIHLLPSPRASMDFASVILQETALARTQLVLLSGYDEKGQGEQAAKAGFGSCLALPIRQSQLVECLARVTKRTASDVTMLARPEADGDCSSTGAEH